MSELQYDLKLIEKFESKVDPNTGFRETVSVWYWFDSNCEEYIGPFTSAKEAIADYLEIKKL